MYNSPQQPYPPYPYPNNDAPPPGTSIAGPSSTGGPGPSPGWSPYPDRGPFPPVPEWFAPNNQAGPSTGSYPPPPPPPSHSAPQGYTYPPPPGQTATAAPMNPSTSASFASPQQGHSTPEQPGSAKSTSAKGDKATAAKKKRKKSTVAPAEDTSPGGDADKEKRIKTGRACDACRTKKIRCDILPNEDWTSTEPICAHCKQYHLECTFFLPITETRFKKKKATDEMSETVQNVDHLISRGGTNSNSPAHMAYTTPRNQEVPARLEGPTSLSFLLHTALPAATSEAYDMRHHQKWEISEDGNGLIRVHCPPTSTGYADADPDDPTKAHNRLNKPILSAQTITLLVNAYFDHLAPLFPVVSRADFTSKANPSPLLLYSICGLGATMRTFPREVFSGVRGVINGLLRSNDILSDARFEHVQALLILAQAGDLHAQPTAATASASLIRMGTATRMAQDLGLHRESTLRAQSAQDLAYVELRRRVWAACVIMDRWYGAALGIPLLVDLLDCDVLLPAPYEIIPDADPSTWPIEPAYMALSEHLKLSILIGRVLKTIYSPTGLKHATDAQLESLRADMEAWITGLPEELKYKGPRSSHAAGMLHLSHCAMQFLFWRVFMRITYTCPPHLTFGLETSQWSRLVEWSQECIQWLFQNDDTLDSVFIFPYTATSSALIQYHTWARRRDPAALEALRLIKETAQKWEATVQPDQMSIRRKTCETMTLLYEAALKTTAEIDDKAVQPKPINPTAGVQRREELGKAVFIKDPTHPAGGIWVVSSDDERKKAGVREVVLVSELQTEEEQSSSNGQAHSGQQPLSVTQNQNHARIQHDAPNQGGQGQGNIMAPTDILQNLPVNPNSINVNPQLNFDDLLGDGGTSGTGFTSNSFNNGMSNGFMGSTGTGPPGFDFTGVNGSGMVPMMHNGGADGTGFDSSLLEGLPLNQFNWNEWNTYFEQLDRMFPNNANGAITDQEAFATMQ